MKTPAEVVDRFFSRGAMPDVIRLKRWVGSVPPGAVLTWSPAARCFLSEVGAVVGAYQVRYQPAWWEPAEVQLCLSNSMSA